MEQNNQPVQPATPSQPTTQSAQPNPPTPSLKSQAHPSVLNKYVLTSFGVIALTLIWGTTLLLPAKKQGVATVKQNGASSLEATNTGNQKNVAGNVASTTTQITNPSGSPLNTTQLPLGDNKYTTSGPKKGYIYLCNVGQGGGGAQTDGPWIHGTTWSLQEKISVSGHVSWSNAVFTSTISGSNHVLSGNDLPQHMTTGIFPIQSTDPAYQYDRNPNSIAAHTFSLTLPVTPTLLSTPQCIGGEVGLMLNGVPLFNGFDAEHRDAAAHEVQDSCDGHPQEAGEYHYHSLSRCMTDIKSTTVLGYALDGFPITGPVLSNGNYLSTNDLDECHGMTSQITLDGKSVPMYHYVMTKDFPYSVSCFRGKPVQMQVIANAMSGQRSGSSQQGMPGPSGSQLRQPPQAAFTACSSKQKGTTCSFSGPNSTISGTCQTPPNQTQLVCVPANPPR